MGATCPCNEVHDKRNIKNEKNIESKKEKKEKSQQKKSEINKTDSKKKKEEKNEKKNNELKKTESKKEKEEKSEQKNNESITRKVSKDEIKTKINQPKIEGKIEKNESKEKLVEDLTNKEKMESWKNEKEELNERLNEDKERKENVELSKNEIDPKQSEKVTKKFEIEAKKSENKIQNEIDSKQNEKDIKKSEIENEIVSKNFEIVSKQKDIKSNHYEFNLKFVEEISNEENIYEIKNDEPMFQFVPEKNEIPKEHKPIPFRIVNRVMKSLCKIQSNMYYEVGFFLNFSVSLKFLITNYNLINPNNNIEIEIWNQKKMRINKKDRFIKYIEKPKDISIIEIKQSDEIYNDIEFLNYDLNFINNG